MKLGFSNIAWSVELDDQVSKVLVDSGFSAVEIAPTKYWQNQFDVPVDAAKRLKKFWLDRGLEITAMQSLLFGKPECQLFGSLDQRNALRSGLKSVIELSVHLGARKLVFGSPKNRLRGSLPVADAREIAIEFFSEIGEFAYSHGSTICLEANAKQYGCDFINTSDESADLVASVGSPGFGLHLDVGNMVMEGEDLGGQFARLIKASRHLHLSRPQMAPFSGISDEDREWVSAIYAHRPATVSVEMLVPTGMQHDQLGVIASSAKAIGTLLGH